MIYSTSDYEINILSVADNTFHYSIASQFTYVLYSQQPLTLLW